MSRTSANKDDAPNKVHILLALIPLVENKKMSVQLAVTITEESLEASALSTPLIKDLVIMELLTAEQALGIAKVAYQASALSSNDIYDLIVDTRMTIPQAFAIPKIEIDNPIEYLSQLENLTPSQEKRLMIYTENPGISAYNAELILILASKTNRLPSENEELALLRDPASRAYTKRIMILKINNARTAKDDRELALLCMPHARPYAREIAYLEFKPDKTENDTEKLETLYLNVCCKVAAPNPGMRALTELLNSRSSHFFPQTNTVNTKNMILNAIKKELVLFYVSKNKNFKPTILETPTMESYIKHKTNLFYHAILRYFVDQRSPEFSGASLAALISTLQEKMLSGVFAFMQVDKIHDLHALLSSTEQSHENAHVLNHH